jgi:hypothetical protein
VTRSALRGLLAGIILCGSTCGIGQAAEAPALAKDLQSVIALLGLPCGEVVKVENHGKDDNLATCKDGNRYRVYVNADGRVVAERQ